MWLESVNVICMLYLWGLAGLVRTPHPSLSSFYTRHCAKKNYIQGIDARRKVVFCEHIPIWLPVEQSTGRMYIDNLCIHNCAIALLWVLLCCIAKKPTTNGFLDTGCVFARWHHIQLVSVQINGKVIAVMTVIIIILQALHKWVLSWTTPRKSTREMSTTILSLEP